jgi:hypothetical protein
MFPHVMKTFILDNGLFMDKATVPPTLCGYVFEFPGKGAFEPNSRFMIADEIRENKTREATPEEIATHNRLLGEMELNGMKEHGKGVLYLTRSEDGRYSVATWSGAGKTNCHHVRHSWHNFAGRDGRTDVYFTMAGKVWHGVNIGDSQICRCHVLKRQPR